MGFLISESVSVSATPVDLNINVGESVGISESSSILKPFLTAIVASSLLFSESVALEVEAPPDPQVNVAETLYIHETSTGRVGDILASVAESVRVQENAVTELGDLEIDASDSLEIHESADATLDDLEASVAESLEISESASGKVGTVLGSVAESIGLTESVSGKVGDVLASVAESLEVAEDTTVFVSAEGDRDIDVGESIGISESASGLVEGDLSASVSESLQISESATASVSEVSDRPVDVGESLGIHEAASAALDNLRVNVSESFEATESSAGRPGTVLASVAESLEVSESAQAALSDLEVSAAETIEVSESASGLVTGDLDLSVSDSIELHEASAVQCGDVTTHSISVGESIGIAEASTGLVTGDLSLSVAESLEISEASEGEFEIFELPIESVRPVLVREDFKNPQSRYRGPYSDALENVDGDAETNLRWQGHVLPIDHVAQEPPGAPTDRKGLITKIVDGTLTVMAWDPNGNRWVQQALPSLPSTPTPQPFAHFRDRKTTGTDAGSFNSGSWRTRTLNYEQNNDIPNVSLASNQVTLPPGCYYVRARAPVHEVDRNVLRLYDTTASAVLLESGAHKAGTSTGDNDWAILEGRIALEAEGDIELQHRCQTSRENIGLGEASNIGSYEYYAELLIWQIAPHLSVNVNESLAVHEATDITGDWDINVAESFAMSESASAREDVPL